MKQVTINGRWPIILPNHRADRPEWTTPEGWERARLDSMYETLTKHDRVFYIGAEEGDMAGLIAQWGANIALFEPNDKVWPNIQAIWYANDLPMPMFTFCGFAGNENKNHESAIVSNNFPPSADGALIPDHGFKELYVNEDIPVIKIDDIPVTPTALAIDVEGSEWEVLRGAYQTLLVQKPKIWLSVHPEFMFRIYGQYQFELRKWIKDLGYKETILDYQHELHLFYEPL